MREKGKGKGRSGESVCGLPGEHRAELRDGQAAQPPTLQGAKGAGEETGTSPYLTLTESKARAAIVAARGDVFIAAQFLKISVIQLNHFLRGSTLAQKAKQAADELGVSLELTDEEFAKRVAEREKFYRIVALDAIHDLATMPISETPAQNQVKLEAATRLAGPSAQQTANNEVGELMRHLNERYAREAPRLKMLRETLTVELPQPERDVSPEAQKP